MIGDVKNTGSFGGYFKSFKYKDKTPEFVIGVTFGADLEVWRRILSELFGDSFSKREKFEKAILITDKVSVSDSSRQREFLKDDLNVCIKNVPGGYLHTKLILIKYSDCYKLAVPTKNFQGSLSYDLIMGFNSVKAETPSHGSKLRNYLQYLCKDIGSVLDGLEKLDFVPEKEGWRLDDIEFSYDGNRFTDNMWNGVLSCSMMISPFIDRDTVSRINQDVKLLTYQNSIQKLDQLSPNISFYTGKFTKTGFEHFHAKLYAKQEDNNTITIIYYGSANLTVAARNHHCEMLLKLIAPTDEYKNIESIFGNDSLVQEYNDTLTDSLTEGDDLEDDSSDTFASANALSKLYVSRDGKGFRLNLSKKDASYYFVKATFYIEIGCNNISKKQILICPQNYDDESAKNKGGLTYDEYAKLAESNRSKDAEKNDLNVFLGTNSGRGGMKKEKANGTTEVAEPIPCFYSTFYSSLAKDPTATAEKVLKKIKDELYTEEYIEFIGKLLEKMNNGGNGNGTP